LAQFVTEHGASLASAGKVLLALGLIATPVCLAHSVAVLGLPNPVDRSTAAGAARTALARQPASTIDGKRASAAKHAGPSRDFAQAASDPARVGELGAPTRSARPAGLKLAFARHGQPQQRAAARAPPPILRPGHGSR